MTVVPSGYLGYLTLWPTGDAQPVVSTLNALEGQLVANAALVPAGTGGAVNVFVTNATHVVIDTNGYFQ
jgi:glyceraldehyde-3-phosphate dehydrogenase/erythrose-4-phosphate dehydrogenase